jgi:hypothetical protein
MSGTYVGTSVGAGGGLVGSVTGLVAVGLPTLNTALHASRKNKHVLMNRDVRLRLKKLIAIISSFKF